MALQKGNRQNENSPEVREWIKRAGGTTLGNRFFMWIITRLGLSAAYLFLVPASIQYTLLDKKSKTAIRQYRTNLGLKTNFLEYARHFYAFGISLIDRYFFLLSRNPGFTYDIINEKLIESECARGKGVILLGAHFGNWELAGNLLHDRLKTPINFIMLDTEKKGVKETLQRATDNRRASVIFVSPNAPDTMIEVVNALRRGEIVCFHGDRTLDGQRCEQVPFFGKPAKFPHGPFAIAAMTGASLIPIFTTRIGPKKYSFRAFNAIRLADVNRAQRNEKIKESIELYVATLEKMVRKYPYEWFNFFQFWDS